MMIKAKGQSILLLLATFHLFSGIITVQANFNVFMDREEVHRLLGLSSDIYLVREGVVNEYALNFIVNVPAHTNQLQFKWQSLTKKPVHYEMVIEFADFFALLQPSSNISNVGRLPQKLETFGVNLPCSGRITTEVPVILRFTFHMKHLKHNVTIINVKRNKICLLKEHDRGVGGSGSSGSRNLGNESPGNIKTSNTTTSLLFPNPPTSPRLLLGGLLGGCALTASVVFITFFVCLRKKLLKLDNSTRTVQISSTSTNCSSSDGSGCIIGKNCHITSPVCILRHDGKLMRGCGHQSNFQSPSDTNWISPADLLKFTSGESSTDSSNNKDKLKSNLSRSGLNPNSFWKDILATTINTATPEHIGEIHSDHTQPLHQFHHHILNSHNNSDICQPRRENKSRFAPNNSNFSADIVNNDSPRSVENAGRGRLKGSDVSPYAYSQIIALPPASKKPFSIPPNAPPSLIELYSQFPTSNHLCAGGQGHIYANNLCSTFNPKPISFKNGGAGGLETQRLSNEMGMANTHKANDDDLGQNDGNYSTATATTTGSGSFTQIDGFHCRKNLQKEKNVIERFL